MRQFPPEAVPCPYASRQSASRAICVSGGALNAKSRHVPQIAHRHTVPDRIIGPPVAQLSISE